MWKYLCTGLAILAFTACHTHKNMPKSDTSAEITNYSLPEGLNVSASFRMFWEAWNNDIEQHGQTPDEYIPSELLKKRFSLREQNGEYLLSGYLHTEKGFDPEALSAIGGMCTAYGDSIYSFAIPLKSLTRFIALPGIRYIESASPVRNRQQPMNTNKPKR